MSLCTSGVRSRSKALSTGSSGSVQAYHQYTEGQLKVQQSKLLTGGTIHVQVGNRTYNVSAELPCLSCLTPSQLS